MGLEQVYPPLFPEDRAMSYPSELVASAVPNGVYIPAIIALKFSAAGFEVKYLLEHTA